MSPQPESITIRILEASDARRLRRLAERDSASVPAGTLLGAEQAGALTAAIALESGEVIADPFRHTAATVEMLRTRARQLLGTPSRRAAPIVGRVPELRPLSAARAAPSSARPT